MWLLLSLVLRQFLRLCHKSGFYLVEQSELSAQSGVRFFYWPTLGCGSFLSFLLFISLGRKSSFFLNNLCGVCGCEVTCLDGVELRFFVLSWWVTRASYQQAHRTRRDRA